MLLGPCNKAQFIESSRHHLLLHCLGTLRPAGNRALEGYVVASRGYFGHVQLLIAEDGRPTANLLQKPPARPQPGRTWPPT
eukprot:10688952-Karenia_brevis.AAC.2